MKLKHGPLLVLLFCLHPFIVSATPLLVSEYGSGNVRAFVLDTGNEITLPAHYTPVGGNDSGADGMALDESGRLYVNHGDGTISRRSLDGTSFSIFADLEVLYLLDLTRNETHLFAAQYAANTIFSVALSDASISTIAGPVGTDRFDGVRIGPDGRLYTVESADGGIYAYDLDTSTWSTFLAPDNAGDASQIEFGTDGRVFLSRTISGEARIYAYTFNTPGDYTSGLDASSQTLIGVYGSSGAATGIRIGPDGRLYANAFNAGEVWRSDIGITAMEATAFITGLNEPGSIFFEIESTPEGPVILIDFGIDSHETPSPDANTNYWNNFSTDSAQAPTGVLTNLITLSNTLSGIQASISGFGNGANAVGTTVPDPALGSLAISSATRDSFFVETGTGTISFVGMAPNRYYRIECFGARDATDTRVTRYTATGANTNSATLQTSGSNIGQAPESGANNAALATINNVRPNAFGAMTLSVTVESGSFGYLGAIRITQMEEVSGPNEAPVASDVILVGAPAEGRTLRVHYIYADAEGDLEGSTQINWQFDAPPFNNPVTLLTGTNTTIALPGETGAYVRAAVTPIAQSGTLTGTVVYSEWLGPIAPADAITVFHIGNSFTRWGHIPLQVQTLAEDAGYAHVYDEQLRDGEGLAYHWANGLANGVWTRGTPSRLQLETGAWDWLVLQPMSREWEPANFPALLDYAYRFASLAHSNGTQVLLYQYWNYEDEGTDVQDDINEAFRTLRTALATNGVPALILPAGEVFGAAVDNIPALSRPELYQDNIHPSDIGYYLSALAHFAVIYRQSPVGLTNSAISSDSNDDTPVLIDPVPATAMQDVVWDVCRFHPHTGITSGRFTEWAATLPVEERGWTDTPFEDGIANIVRWTFGLPQSSGQELYRLPSGSADGPSLSFAVGADAEDAGIRILEEWTEDLVHGVWTNQSPTGFIRTRSINDVDWTLGGTWTTIYHRTRILLPTE